MTISGLIYVTFSRVFGPHYTTNSCPNHANYKEMSNLRRRSFGHLHRRGMMVGMKRNDYTEIRAAVDASMARPPRFTFSTLVLALMEVHGGSEAVWRKRVNELLAGGALVRGLDPEAKMRPGTLRILPGPNTVEVALAVALGAPRVRARDRAGAGVQGMGSAPTPATAPAVPQTVISELLATREAEEAAFESWWYNEASIGDRSRVDHARLVRESRRSGVLREHTEGQGHVVGRIGHW